MPKIKNMKSKTEQTIENFASLGKRVDISPKAKISINKEGYTKQYFVPSVEVLIGIGADHTATLIMDVEAWKALKKGDKLDITTI